LEDDVSDEQLSQPIKHDGYRSRRFLASSLFALLILSAATWLSYKSGSSGGAWFTADHWISTVWVVCAILAFGWGLMTVDKAIELIKLIAPLVGQYLKAKFGKAGA
jgi:hypothetical protein